jgi:GTP-binding protein
VVLADVPGLIEGAHEGRGLGDRFLRHVSRCRALVWVVDVSGEDPVADLAGVRSEVAAYDPDLAARPGVIAATKADLVDPEKAARRAADLAEHGEVFLVSGETGEGLDALTERLGPLAQESAGARTPFVVLRPGREPFTVRREGAAFRVEGVRVERWVAGADLQDPRQVSELQDRLRREGVERRLQDSGARRGDEVRIGDRAFEYIPEEP